MDEKTKELIAIGASVATNCQPCLTFHVDRAAEIGINEEEIREALAIGARVQKGGMNAMQRFIEKSFQTIETPSSRTAKKGEKQKASAMKVYDPAMCCSTGVCGPNVDPRLIAFAGALKQVAAQGVAVERFNLAQQPQVFVENAQVKAHLGQLGHERLPFIYVDDELKFSGGYPEPAALFAALGLEPGTTGHDPGSPGAAQEALILPSLPGANENADGCCPGGGCC